MNPMQQLGAASEATLAAFQSLRKAVLTAGPLDERVCELIVTASFATIGSEASFKTHAKRLVAMSVPKAEIQQAILVTFGATTTFAAVTQALAWLDEIT
jgi:alkylhydroperoxidase/carboxymuconolactone decarboxylase family protein YurZ